MNCALVREYAARRGTQTFEVNLESGRLQLRSAATAGTRVSLAVSTERPPDWKAPQSQPRFAAPAALVRPCCVGLFFVEIVELFFQTALRQHVLELAPRGLTLLRG